MELAKLKEYIELMNRHRLEELEVEEGGLRIRLKKQGDRVEQVVAMPAAAAGAGMVIGSKDAASAVEPSVADGTQIPSPMVGTFFRSPNPDAEPFVEDGDRVEEGKVLCIIEAMKVMNEVKAEQACTIEEILVPNGDPVEYGQPLFRIS